MGSGFRSFLPLPRPPPSNAATCSQASRGSVPPVRTKPPCLFLEGLGCFSSLPATCLPSRRGREEKGGSQGRAFLGTLKHAWMEREARRALSPADERCCSPLPSSPSLHLVHRGCVGAECVNRPLQEVIRLGSGGWMDFWPRQEWSFLAPQTQGSEQDACLWRQQVLSQGVDGRWVCCMCRGWSRGCWGRQGCSVRWKG